MANFVRGVTTLYCKGVYKSNVLASKSVQSFVLEGERGEGEGGMNQALYTIF